MEGTAAGTNVGAPVLPGAPVTPAVWRRAPTTLSPPTGRPVLELRPFLLGVTQAPWWQRWSSQAGGPLLKGWGVTDPAVLSLAVCLDYVPRPRPGPQ